MNASASIRAILTLVVAVFLVTAVGTERSEASADFPRYLKIRAGETVNNRPVRLGVNKSLVVELPVDAGDVLVSNPEIADAVLRTSRRLYLIGVKLGQANIFLFDGAGGQIASFDVYVDVDLTALNRLLAEAIPDGIVRAEGMNGNIVLRGEVSSAAESSRAQEITVGMLQGTPLGKDDEGGGGELEKKVVNLLTIIGVEQVSLKVTIAEVQREVVKQLGINTQALIESGSFTFGRLVGGSFAPATVAPLTFPFTSGRAASTASIGFDDGTTSVNATIRALEETRMLRTLAEPTLTAVSGETANFLVGGEFPIPVSTDDNGITVAFKQFGVNLAFTPVVLSAGRISLKVRAEVSDIASEGAFAQEFGLNQALVIPGISVRRTETTVELPSGGAFVLAGLVQEETRRALNGLPGLRKLPILGALFSSKDFIRADTELVVIATPYLVKPVSPKQLARPDDNLVLANDREAFFMNRLTKIYGNAADRPAGSYTGSIGFSFD